MLTAQKNISVQKWVLAVSILLFSIKMVAYFLTNSVAIFTDALESVVNVITGFTGLYSLQIAARPRDRNHPYGHGKIELISATFEGSLIVVAGLIIIYESIINLLHPHEIKSLDWGMILLAITALANYLVGFQCIKIGERHRSMALTASGKHLQSDTWTTLGIICGLILVRFTSIKWLDSATALLFAGVIILEGGKIIRQTLAGIMDETDDILLREVIALLDAQKRDNWVDLHNLRILKYGSLLHLDCHLTVPWYFTVQKAHDEMEAVAALIHEKYPEMPEFFVHIDACEPPESCRICPLKNCTVRQADFEKRVVWTLENVTENRKHGV